MGCILCGIAGYRVNREVAPNALNYMMGEIVHRGPDDYKVYNCPGYAVGTRRLSIVDIEHGFQPFFNRDKTVVVNINGEIYNYSKLRSLMEEKGAVFRSNCDGEIIGHLYDIYGEELFGLLEGMFSISLWDKNNQKLILARDIPGEKPLYYSKLGQSEVVFASELKSLTKFPGLDLSLNRRAVWDLPTFLWIPEPDTIYQNIRALEPGKLLICDASGISIRSYIPICDFGVFGHLSWSDKKAYVRDIVTQAVESRLLGDVPIGCFLSGGLDSSIVAAIASNKISDLKSFSVGFDDIIDPYHGFTDETEYAEHAASAIGTIHQSVYITSDSCRDDFEKFCYHCDQPFAVSSGFGVMAVARAASEVGVKVLLGGDGADECFGGYSWYQYLDNKRYSPVPPPDDSNAISFQNFGVPLEERLEAIYSYPPEKQAWAWHYYASETEKAALFSEDISAFGRSSVEMFNSFKKKGQGNPVDFVNHDRNFYLPNEMLTKLDRMTMAFSVEGRSPFVASGVMNIAEQLIYSEMIQQGVNKKLLRDAFVSILPDEVICRPKHGFNVPIDHWLKGDWSDMFDHTFSEVSALARNNFISKDASRIARTMLADPFRLNGHTLFCFMVLNHWLERNPWN